MKDITDCRPNKKTQKLKLRHGACLLTVMGQQNPMKWPFPARSSVLGASSVRPMLADSFMLSGPSEIGRME